MDAHLARAAQPLEALEAEERGTGEPVARVASSDRLPSTHPIYLGSIELAPTLDGLALELHLERFDGAVATVGVWRDQEGQFWTEVEAG
jgi:hypothetical protein